jgi:hypothetical protein
MPNDSALANLPHIPPPILTAYLDVNPANPRNQGTPRGYLSWLKSAGQALGRELPRDARKLLKAQLARINDHLAAGAPRARGLAVFAGPHVWEVVPLQVDVAEELHWGKASMQQMAWILDEHRPRGAVLVDGSGARFFRFWLGSVTEDEAMTFFIDFSSWRKPHLRGPATSAVAKQYGVQRDRFANRVAAQRSRFATTLARRIEQWSSEGELSPIVLVGAAPEIDEVAAALPAELRARTPVIRKALSNLSPEDVKKRLAPVLGRWERDYETALVDELLAAGGRRAAIGLDETLAQLQSGSVLELVIARGATGDLRECLACGRLDRSADPVCAACGGERRPRTLRTALPELASVEDVPIEVVSGGAARKLRAAGGVAARLGTLSRAAPRPAPRTAAKAGKVEPATS